MEKKTIGGFIAALRSKRHDPKDLAERLNVSDKTVSRWGGMMVHQTWLRPAIAEIFGVTCD